MDCWRREITVLDETSFMRPGGRSGGLAGQAITPGEAASLSTLVANTAKAVETFELAERLTRLEEQTAAKGGTP